MEKIVALVCTAVVFVAAIIIGVTCTLRSKEKMKTRKYKEKERIDAGKWFICVLKAKVPLKFYNFS